MRQQQENGHDNPVRDLITLDWLIYLTYYEASGRDGPFDFTDTLQGCVFTANPSVV